MAPRPANEVRPAGLPLYCSACFNQDSSKQHIDFDAACDRGYGEHTPDGVKVSMDDLILCEECVRAGAVQVGMMDVREFEEKIHGLERAIERERYRADQAENYASQLESAMDARPVEVLHPRRRGRPRREEVEA